MEIKQLRYLAQDETRIGRKTETKRVITSRGVKPKAKVSVAASSILAVWRGRTTDRLAVDSRVQQTQSARTFRHSDGELSVQLGSTVAVMQLDRAPAPKGTSN